MAKKAAKKEASAAKKAAPKAVAKSAAKPMKAEPKAKAEVKSKPEAKVVAEKPSKKANQVESVSAPAPAAAKVVAATKKTKAEKAAAAEENSQWLELNEKHKDEKPQNYDMRAVFEAGKALQHKILGWGWILSNENDRLEVLFQDGKRILISNYNPK